MEGALDSLLESACGGVEPVPGNTVFVEESAESRGACSHSHGVSRERSCLVDGTQGRKLFHQLTPPTVGADGQSTADDLAESHEVGRDTGEGGGATGSKPEARDDFIEDQ